MYLKNEEIKRRWNFIYTILLCWGLILSLWIYKIVFEIRETIHDKIILERNTYNIENDQLQLNDKQLYHRKLKIENYDYSHYNINGILKNQKPKTKQKYQKQANPSVFIKLSDKDMPKNKVAPLYHFSTSERTVLKSYLYNEMEPFQLFDDSQLKRNNFPEWIGHKNLPPWMEKFWEDEVEFF